MKTKSLSWRLLSLLAGAMLAGSASAGPIQVLLDEDFQNVSGLTGSGTDANTIRTVQDILDNNPTQLDGSPVTSFTGDALVSSFNVRRWNNPIDGGSSSINNFDNFFGNTPNQFLVIGDESGNLGGEPNGAATMSIKFALAPIILGSPQRLDIAFDYVFDANNASNPDGFIAELILANNSTFNLLSIGAPSATTRGAFSLSIPYVALVAAPVSLNFRLVEGSGNGSSAVGLDNLQVQAVPEPASLALLGVGLIGLGFLRRRKT